MKISYNWLKWYIPEIPDPKELENIITFKLCELEETIQGGDDTIFNLKILPDRAGDLLSHLGVARELSGLLGIPFVDPSSIYKTPQSNKTNFKVNIESDRCKRYMARVIRNFKVGPSPEWVVKHLSSIGERSINNIVDASNIVMFNCGQPTHAFDLKKLKSESITVADSKIEFDFPVVGSDNLVVKIKEGDLVVKSDDQIIALAGIKGGTNSGISIDEPYTTDLVLEVANFDPVAVRRTGQRLSLLSDARKRFENNVPIELAPYAMNEFSSLLLEMCPDAFFEDIIDIKKSTDEEQRVISFTTDIISSKLGIKLDKEDIAKILSNYKYRYEENDGKFKVYIPYYRKDLSGIHDIVEEFGRVYGYEKVFPILPKFSNSGTDDEIFNKINKIKSYLTNLSYSEVLNYSFVKSGDIQVAHGLKGKDFLRTNLSDGLKHSFEKNRLNAPVLGKTEIKIFEIGNVFPNKTEEIRVAIASKDGIKEWTVDDFIKNEIDKDYLTDINKNKINFDNKFKIWSDYPYISRDVSFWSTKQINEELFISLIENEKIDLLIRKPYQIDSFKKGEKHSYAFRFVFQSMNQTLTDEEVSIEMSKVYDLLKKNDFEIR